MKKELREKALARRNNIPTKELAEKNRKITACILQNELYKNAKTVFSFVSMGSEVETADILRQAWEDGKTVAVPRTATGRKMTFLKIESFDDLQEGRFGVLEPVGGEEHIPKAGDLFLVPGVLFDKKKNRIGYGGGYYDRYFEKYQGYRRVGIGFSEQISETSLPTAEYDIPLDAIVTENGWEE